MLEDVVLDPVEDVDVDVEPAAVDPPPVRVPPEESLDVDVQASVLDGAAVAAGQFVVLPPCA